MLERLDKELENILVEAGMYNEGWLAISTIRERYIVDVEFIDSPKPHLYHSHLWTEKNVYFCDSPKWKFIVSMWSNEPMTFQTKWYLVKNYQSRISALIRDLSEGKGVFKDETWDVPLATLQEQELAQWEAWKECEKKDKSMEEHYDSTGN